MSEKKAGWKDNLAYFFRCYWVFCLGAVLLLVVASGVLYSVFHRAPEPDYCIAVMTRQELPPAVQENLRQTFTEAADDRNEDGQTWVEIKQFSYAAVPDEGIPEQRVHPYEQAADTVLFSAEAQESTCLVYLLSEQTLQQLSREAPDFFVPLSRCIDGVETETLPVPAALHLEAPWSDYVLALRNPSGLKNRTDEWNSNLKLLQAVCSRS